MRGFRSGWKRRPVRQAGQLPFDFPEKSAKTVPANLTEESEEVEANVFDILSKTLEFDAAKLGPDEAKRESDLRPKFLASLRSFSIDLTIVCQQLVEYRVFYKGKRQWVNFAEKAGAAINCSARTVFRMIDDYQKTNEGTRQLIDKADHSKRKLNAIQIQARHERSARRAIHSFLNNIPEDEKPKALADLLAEEAFQFWGRTEPFNMEITPHPGKSKISGRRVPAATTETVRAA